MTDAVIEISSTYNAKLSIQSFPSDVLSTKPIRLDRYQAESLDKVIDV